MSNGRTYARSVLQTTLLRASFVAPPAAALTLVIALALPSNAQTVISTHSGVVHFFDGSVYLGDQSLESHLGKFPTVPQGGELRTADGRAEILLTPGVFLRMGEQSSIRMVSNELADTRVELESGAVMIEAGNPNLHTSVSVIYKNWRVHLLEKGVYRVDSDPPRLFVREGRAEVFAGTNAQPVSAEAGMSMPFASVLVPEQASEPSQDALSDWSKGRNQSVTSDNAITAQIDEDPASTSLTYFPPLGLSPMGLGPYGSAYSSYYPSQLGFSSIYLPGYNYPPLLILGQIGGVGIGGMRIGGMGVGIPSYRPGYIRPGYSTPGYTPVIGPRGTMPRPPVMRAPTSVGVHAVGHR
jgi:FecR protein